MYNLEYIYLITVDFLSFASESDINKQTKITKMFQIQVKHNKKSTVFSKVENS